MKVYWVRHGKTVYNTEYRLQGWSDSPLVYDDISPEIAASSLEGIKFDHICSSDLKRAIDTRDRIINHLNIKDTNLSEYKEFREISFGEWETMPVEDIIRDYGEHWKLFKDRSEKYDPTLYGGEKISDVKNRVNKRLDILKEKYGNDSTILVVSHGTTISIINGFKDIPDNGEIVLQEY